MNIEILSTNDIQSAITERQADCESIQLQIRTAEVQQQKHGEKMDVHWYMGAVKALRRAKADVRDLQLELASRKKAERTERNLAHVFIRVAKTHLDQVTYDRLLDMAKCEAEINQNRHATTKQTADPSQP